ncbi:MAG: Mut7-C RNAse domain-containing protein [Candidatus Micrarchaeota archaeon]
MPEPGFLADVMLQKLARWLRMLGCSVHPPISTNDDDLIRQAADSNLILLTRDVALFKKARDNCRAHLLKTDDLDLQLKEMLRKFKIPLRKRRIPSETICSICNGKLEKVAKEEVRSSVPKKSFASVSDFLRCKACGKIFWKGSHNKKIIEKITRLR